MERFKKEIQNVLSPLKHKIEQEEKLGKKAIIVMFATNQIKSDNYSKELTKEIAEHLGKLDQKKMWENIDNDLRGLLN